MCIRDRGALNRIRKLVDNDVLKEALLKRVPKGTEELNLKAFEMGGNIV